MSIRERQLTSVAYSSGNTSLVDLPRDAVFHWLSLSCMGGSFTEAQGAMTGTGSTLIPSFPFSIIRNLRLLRNGSDVVIQASGEQLAKEHFYLNKSHPLARLYTVSGQAETLRTASVRGITIPGNSEGIGANGGGFSNVTNAGGNGVVNFDFQLDLWLQVSPDDAYYSTILDARKLATFQLEIQWNSESALLATTGTLATAQAVVATLNILSMDQDNLDVENDFGTFKRSVLSISNFTYGSNNNQVLLPRGNFYHGVILGTRAFKTGSTVNPLAENNVISTVDNRINSNFSLRKVDFRQLQAKNMADAGGRQQAYDTSQGGPQGYAYMSYHNVGQKAAEMVPTYVMDQFDMQLSIQAIGSATNATTTASTNPQIDLLIEEVIPGVSIGGSAPRGSQAGSIGRSSAKPYSR